MPQSPAIRAVDANAFAQRWRLCRTAVSVRARVSQGCGDGTSPPYASCSMYSCTLTCAARVCMHSNVA